MTLTGVCMYMYVSCLWQSGRAEAKSPAAAGDSRNMRKPAGITYIEEDILRTRTHKEGVKNKNWCKNVLLVLIFIHTIGIPQVNKKETRLLLFQVFLEKRALRVCSTEKNTLALLIVSS